MSAHPPAALPAPHPSTVSPPTQSPVHRGGGTDKEPESSATTRTMTFPLEPHWEPVVSAATD